MEKASSIIPFIGACCCFGSAFAVTLTLCLNYSDLLRRADYFNEIGAIDRTDYDLCGGAYGEASMETSGWTQMYTLNYYVYLVMACLSGSALLCVPCAPVALCAVIYFSCSGIPATVAIIISGIRLLSDKGDTCARNDTFYNEDEELSFAGDAEMWRKLWISQIVFHIPLSCFVSCGMAQSFAAMVLLARSTRNSFRRSGIFH